jgi:hypothetical protein
MKHSPFERPRSKGAIPYWLKNPSAHWQEVHRRLLASAQARQNDLGVILTSSQPKRSWHKDVK